MAAQTNQTLCKGVVKQVLSGDSVIVRGVPRGGPPPEWQINFSSVIAPRLARRGTPSLPETTDEPYAWESREFLRKKLIGKEVLFNVETTTNTGRKYGTIMLVKDSKSENVTETMISEGLVTVRREGIRSENNYVQLEDAAKSDSKGKWGSNAESRVRKITWNIENQRSLVEEKAGKRIKAIIEHVRDGSTIRAFLLPNFYHVTLMISGIRCPSIKMDSDGRPDKDNAESFAQEAKYFVESRLLQRDVEIILESTSNTNFVGSIVHPNGNIAELLLKDGFARCVDWSLATVSGGAEKLRAAERLAKERKLRIWADYKPSTSGLSNKEKEISGKVSEIVNGDALMIKENNGQTTKVFLASIRPPRLQDTEGQQKVTGKNFRPLYDVPWLFEAREFLRKRLIGQKIKAQVDYVQPAQNNFPKKTCCTIHSGNENIAEAMVAEGLATVVRYRQDDDQRARCYDDLMSAEVRASKALKGLHGKKDIPIHRVADLSGDVTKAKNFFPFLQRAAKIDGIIEFVASGSRARLYIPRETCLITFLLGGISCPRASRPAPGGAGGMLPSEPYGMEALAFAKDLILQRDVQIEVDSMDKGGNFIGWLHIDDKNLSVMLVEAGLSSVHSTAEGSKYYSELSKAKESAKRKKLNIWANFVEEEKVERIEDTQAERNIDYQTVMVSEVTREGRLYGQYCSDGPALESLMENLRQEMSKAPSSASYNPRKGELVAAKYVDGSWYRAKVEKLSGGQVSILYVDYGNREVTTAAKCSPLPGRFNSIKPYAHEMALALVKFPKDDDYVEDATAMLMSEVMDKEMKINKEYKMNALEFITLQRADNKSDVARTLLSQGLLMVEGKKDKRFEGLLSEYRGAQDEAKRKHLNIWRYGDITDDDAFEFGMER